MIGYVTESKNHGYREITAIYDLLKHHNSYNTIRWTYDDFKETEREDLIKFGYQIFDSAIICLQKATMEINCLYTVGPS